MIRRMRSLLIRLYARKDGMMDFEGFVSAVTSVLIVDKLQGPNVTRMLGHPLFTEVRRRGENEMVQGIIFISTQISSISNAIFSHHR